MVACIGVLSVMSLMTACSSGGSGTGGEPNAEGRPGSDADGRWMLGGDHGLLTSEDGITWVASGATSDGDPVLDVLAHDGEGNLVGVAGTEYEGMLEPYREIEV